MEILLGKTGDEEKGMEMVVSGSDGGVHGGGESR